MILSNQNDRETIKHDCHLWLSWNGLRLNRWRRWKGWSFWLRPNVLLKNHIVINWNVSNIYLGILRGTTEYQTISEVFTLNSSCTKRPSSSCPCHCLKWFCVVGHKISSSTCSSSSEWTGVGSTGTTGSSTSCTYWFQVPGENLIIWMLCANRHRRTSDLWIQSNKKVLPYCTTLCSMLKHENDQCLTQTVWRQTMSWHIWHTRFLEGIVSAYQFQEMFKHNLATFWKTHPKSPNISISTFLALPDRPVELVSVVSESD